MSSSRRSSGFSCWGSGSTEKNNPSSTKGRSVSCGPEIAATDALKADLANYVKTKLAAHEYPREVEFVTELPLTTTGKIMRRELRRLDAEKKASRRG